MGFSWVDNKYCLLYSLFSTLSKKFSLVEKLTPFPPLAGEREGSEGEGGEGEESQGRGRQAEGGEGEEGERGGRTNQEDQGRRGMFVYSRVWCVIVL